uniref:RAS guanyl-releasing protein 1 n=1 Tax=Pavo cristatus TaxID=9049 RepID=A0A8C9EZ86_PAVCR
MGTLGKKRETQQPAQGCSTAPESSLELKQISHCHSHSNLTQVTMVPLGHLAKGATLEDLLETCIQSFDLEGNSYQNNQLLKMILTMHQFIISSADMLQKLSDLYPFALEKKSSALCVKICYFVRYWITEFWVMFKMDSKLSTTMEAFQELVKANGEELHCRLIDTSQINSRDWSRKLTQRVKANSSKKRKVSLLFDHLEPEELSDHLTYLEFKSFRRISFSDYQSYIVNSCVKENPTMERSIALCNGISQWVQLMVLSRPTPQLRAEVFIKFIHVAQVTYLYIMAVAGFFRLLSNMLIVMPTVTCSVNVTDFQTMAATDWNLEMHPFRITVNTCAAFFFFFLGANFKHQSTKKYECMPGTSKSSSSNCSGIKLTFYEIYELSYAREPRSHRAAVRTFPDSSQSNFMNNAVFIPCIHLILFGRYQMCGNKYSFCLSEFQLWGVIKQGYRCKDCGMNCHKQCKDLIVIECKRRHKTSVADSSPTSALASSLCTVAVKEQFHGQEEGPFTFPNGVVEHNEDSKDRTIMLMGSSAQKISVRLKPAVVHKGIQTDSILLAGDVLHKSMEKKEKRILENPYLQPIPPSPRPSPLLGRKKAYVKWENKDSSQKIKEEHREHHSYKPSYQELERERNILKADNEGLKMQLEQAHKTIESLTIQRRNHVIDSLQHKDCS